VCCRSPLPQEEEEAAEEARAELLHIQRKFADEEKKLEEKAAQGQKARAEAESGVFEDGETRVFVPAACARTMPAVCLALLVGRHEFAPV
jgi:hypothetical protein